jgi:hypothetical protein
MQTGRNNRPVRYPQITRWSLERYRDAMVGRRSSVSDQSQAALDLLLETLGSAVAHGARMEPDEVRFGVTSLAMVPPNELPVFINQYTLGVGWDGAPVVVMGTEPAERADSAEDMAWHAVYSAFVAAESRSEVLDRIVAGSTWQAAAKGGWEFN